MKLLSLPHFYAPKFKKSIIRFFVQLANSCQWDDFYLQCWLNFEFEKTGQVFCQSKLSKANRQLRKQQLHGFGAQTNNVVMTSSISAACWTKAWEKKQWE